MLLRTLDVGEALLTDVCRLGRSQSKTLGFLPTGAYRAYAAQDQVVVALDGEQLAGYVIWRATRLRSMLVHVAVDPAFRRRGVAKAMVGEVMNRSTQLLGVGAWCREDYEANDLWAKLGFSVIREKPGRALSGSRLRLWWRDSGGLSLLTQSQNRPLVVLDTNIIIQLAGETASAAVRALEADWLAGEVRFAVSSEASTELERDSNDARRTRSLAKLAGMETLVSNHIDADLLESLRLAAFGNRPLSENDRSDVLHLATAVSSKAAVFVTTDKQILRSSDVILDDYGVSVLRPYELVRFADRLADLGEYRRRPSPDRVASISKADPNGLAAVLGLALGYEFGETKRQLESTVESLASDRQVSDLYVVEEGGCAVALVGTTKVGGVCQVPLFRVFGTRSTTAVSTFLLRWLVQRAAGQGTPLLRIVDRGRPSELAGLAEGSGFVTSEAGIEKLSGSGCHSPASAIEWLRSLEPEVASSFAGRLALDRLGTPTNIAAHAVVAERLLWPLHLVSAGIRTFVVPIRPVWARELFDYELAAQGLFAPMRDLLMSDRNVYYKSARGLLPDAPCRLVWYVSHDSHYANTSAVRAVSLCERVVVGEARRLFRMYRDLGVYQWADVLHLARGQARGAVAAVELSQVEGLRHVVPLREIQAIVAKAAGKGFHVRSVCEIDDETFKEIYRVGTDVVEAGVR